MKRKPMSRKEALVRMHAARRGVRLLDLLPKAKCTRSVLYRVVKGHATSARIDCVLARALRIPVAQLYK